MGERAWREASRFMFLVLSSLLSSLVSSSPSSSACRTFVAAANMVALSPSTSSLRGFHHRPGAALCAAPDQWRLQYVSSLDSKTVWCYPDGAKLAST